MSVYPWFSYLGSWSGYQEHELLISGQPSHTLHLLDTRNMTVSRSEVCFRIGDLLKTSRPGAHLPELVFPAYPPDQCLCVVTTICCYLDRTAGIRGSITRFFLTTNAPVRLASRDTIRRWTRNVMRDAGIALTIFSPHSTRSASSSKASLTLPVSTILATVGWSCESVFAKFYKRPLSRRTDFARAVLGWGSSLSLFTWTFIVIYTFMYFVVLHMDCSLFYYLSCVSRLYYL